jgi:hypothetical protein
MAISFPVRLGRCLLLELKRAPSPRCLCHLRHPFALEQLAEGYGQIIRFYCSFLAGDSLL